MDDNQSGETSDDNNQQSDAAGNDETENVEVQCEINGNFYEIDTVLSPVCPIGYQSSDAFKDCCTPMIGAPSSFQSAQYGKVTMPKCLSNGKWNTTEILCNLVDAGNPENSEKLKMKKLLLKICFILSGLRKSSQALVNEYDGRDSVD